MKIKQIIASIIALLLLISLTVLPACQGAPASNPQPPATDDPKEEGNQGEDGGDEGKDVVLEETETYTELGIPLAQRYPEGDQARCAWDMMLYEGGILLGSGDYNVNRGPAEIWRYDLASGAFTQSGVVPDEEVNRFSLIFDTVIAPGVDPQEEWELGNYYAYENGEWVKYRVLPGGVHTFEMVEYSGMIFAGMGVEDGKGLSPIVGAMDLDDDFVQFPLYKDGAIRETAGCEYIRVYDFFIHDDELYALFFLQDNEHKEDRCYELYHYDYDKDAFFYEDDWTEKLQRRSYKYIPVGEKCFFDEKTWITTGYLYQTDDMDELTQVTFPGNAVVCDLYVSNGVMYVLTGGKDAESGKLKTTVYALREGETEFREVTSFLYDVPPMSMVVDGDVFYIGMGNGNAKHEKNGMLLRVKASK